MNVFLEMRRDFVATAVASTIIAVMTIATDMTALGLATFSIHAKLRSTPSKLALNSTNGLVRGISDVFGLCLVLAPGSGYEKSGFTTQNRRFLPGIRGIPLPPTLAHQNAISTWPRSGVLGWFDPPNASYPHPTAPSLPGPLGYEGGITFKGDNVLVFFQDPVNCIASAGWLSDVRVIRYGSPFEIILTVMGLPAVVAGIVAMVNYVLSGRAANRKISAEAQQISAAAAIAEAQIPFASQTAMMQIDLNRAQRMVAEAEAQRIHATATQIELENLKSRLNLISDLKNFASKMGDADHWSPEHLWRMLQTPGLMESIENLGAFQPQVELVLDESSDTISDV